MITIQEDGKCREKAADGENPEVEKDNSRSGAVVHELASSLYTGVTGKIQYSYSTVHYSTVRFSFHEHL